MSNRQPQFNHPSPDYYRLEPDKETTGLSDGEPLARVHLPYGGDAWLARRHADARALLTDPRFNRGSVLNADKPRATERLTTMLSLPQMDPPEHTRQRRLVTTAFTARRVEALRPWVEGLVDDLLTKFIETGTPGELVEHIAWPLPIQVIGEMLGVPYESRAQFQDWTDRAISVSAYTSEEAEGGMMSLLGYMAELAVERREKPGDDLLTSLAQVQDEEGGLSEAEVAMYSAVLLIGGYETTAVQLGNFVYTLLSHPDQLAKLKEDPSLVDSTVEELLRFVPMNASVALAQFASEDIEVADVTIETGDTVFIDHAAANRDPRVFENPDELDITRKTNPHLSLGYGVHRCLGAQLARLELTIAIRKIFERLPDLALAVPEDELEWRQGRQMRGLIRLPVTWSQSAK